MESIAINLGTALNLIVLTLNLVILFLQIHLLHGVLLHRTTMTGSVPLGFRPTREGTATGISKHSPKQPEEKRLEQERKKADAEIASAGLYGEKLGEYE